MDAPLVEGEDSNLYDVLRSGESQIRQRVNHESYYKLKELWNIDSREADVVRLYFGLGDQHPMTLERNW
jgi:RNA polymerase primary sigma factor